MRKVAVFTAHADDEALGCSGTILRHVAQGDQVHVIMMTNGVGARGVAGAEGDVLARERRLDAEHAKAIMGTHSLQNFDFPDNQMDSVPLLAVTKAVESVIAALQPEILYTHHVGDLNIDHQVTHKAVMTACRPQPGLCVREIYSFEVPSSTEWQTAELLPFTPNVFVDISAYVETKRKVLGAYQAEMRPSPHSRSVDNVLRLNAWRGHCVGMEYAEAFMLVRKLR